MIKPSVLHIGKEIGARSGSLTFRIYMFLLPTYFSECFLGFQLCMALLSPEPSILNTSENNMSDFCWGNEGAVAQPRRNRGKFSVI